MSRRKTIGVLLALGSALLAGFGVAVHRRLHKLWVIPEAPSRSLHTAGWVEAAPLPSVRVLFVGHSLVNQDMPAMARGVAASVGVDFTYDVQLIDGGSLEVNWNQAERATGVRAREALATGGYDTVVLTEAVNLDDHLRWSEPAVHTPRAGTRWPASTARTRGCSSTRRGTTAASRATRAACRCCPAG
jgi:hypothetical protein